MEAKAVGRYLRVTPRKARYVLDTVRGKSVKEALAMLKFVPNEAARYIRQIVESAVASAEHNYAMDREALRISRAYVDQGPSLKRIHPRAMGRAFRILKRTSHITVVLIEDEALKKVAVKPKKSRRLAVRKREVAESATAQPKQAGKRGAAQPKTKPEVEAAVAKSTKTPAADVQAVLPSEVMASEVQLEGGMIGEASSTETQAETAMPEAEHENDVSGEAPSEAEKAQQE